MSNGVKLADRILQIATAEIGTKEIDGDGNNPRIIQYHTTTALRSSMDSVAWCASFVNWVLREAGLKGTCKANARSFLDWGYPCEPIPGCVVVMKRGYPPNGHVGFYVRHLDRDHIKVLGGNQSDCVKVSTYKAEDVLGYRWVA